MSTDKSYLFDSARRIYSILTEYNPFGYMFPPLRYFLELTYNCNLRCPYCFINKDRQKDEMTTNEWFKIIEQIPWYSFISLVAGEVMIRKDFFEILEKSCKKTYGKVSLITNGLLLNENALNKFIDNNMLLLSVSIDGWGTHHDELRNHKGIFENIISNLELLKALKEKKHKKRPLVDIKSVILEDNLDDLPKIYKEASRLGAEFYSLSFKRNSFLRQNSEVSENFGEEFYKTEYPLEMYFDENHFKEIYSELESLAKNTKTKLRWAPKFKPTGDINRILKYFNFGNEKVTNIYKPCNIPFSSIFITPEGDIYPCLSYKTGNVRLKKLQKVLNSEKHREFLRKLKKAKIFNACQLCCDAFPKTK